MTAKPAVSIIVPVHRAGAFLEALLKGLQHQTNRNFEAVLVGFNNKELSSRILPDRFLYIDAPVRWPDVKRNLGAHQAGAPLLAYIDEDCVPEKDGVESIIYSFDKHPSASTLEGATPGERRQLLSYAIFNEQGDQYPTCNMAFRKKDFLQVKGFDENYHFFREDMDIVFKLKDAGKTVLFEPTMRVFHPERRISAKTFFDELFLVKGDVRLYKKFPKLYHQQLGFLCRGSFKQSVVVWFLALLFVAGLFSTFFLSLLSVFLVVLFRYWIGMRGKKFSFAEGTQFIFATTLHDILFPFFIAYYWFTIVPAENR